MSFNQRHSSCKCIYMRNLPRLRYFTFTITFYFTTKYECTMHYYECIDMYRSGKYISKKNLRKNGLVSLLISPWGSQTNKGKSSVGKCQSVPKDKSYQFHFLFLKKEGIPRTFKYLFHLKSYPFPSGIVNNKSSSFLTITKIVSTFFFRCKNSKL